MVPFWIRRQFDAAYTEVMGVWGVDLFSYDGACDIRDYYLSELQSGMADSSALRLTLDKFHPFLVDAEEGPILILALAVTLWKLGRLEPELRDRALRILEDGADLARWEHENPKLAPKRGTALEKIRTQLLGPQPPQKSIASPGGGRNGCGLSAGDVLALKLMPRRVVLFRVIRVIAHEIGETPVLEELAFDGSEVPSTADIATLRGRAEAHLNPAGSASHRFMVHSSRTRAGGWRAAGFEKVARIPARSGDDDCRQPDTGWLWQSLAARIQDKR